jgi:type II secretory pathway component PulF
MKAILSYPVMVCIIAAISITVMVHFLYPLVKDIARNVKVPPPTQIFMFFGALVYEPWPLVITLSITVLLCVLLPWLLSTPSMQSWWDRTRYHLPLVGSVLRASLLIRLSRSLALLKDAGLPLPANLEITGMTCESPYVRDTILKNAIIYIRRGETLAQALGGIPIPEKTGSENKPAGVSCAQAPNSVSGLNQPGTINIPRWPAGVQKLSGISILAENDTADTSPGASQVQAHSSTLESPQPEKTKKPLEAVKAKPRHASSLFSKTFLGMIAVGEETGDLSAILQKAADLHEVEMNQKIETALRAIEPLLIAALGGMVLLIMVCAFLPLYEVLKSI